MIDSLERSISWLSLLDMCISEHTHQTWSAFLSDVFEDEVGIEMDARNNDISAALKVATTIIDYPGTRGIPIECIGTSNEQVCMTHLRSKL